MLDRRTCFVVECERRFRSISSPSSTSSMTSERAWRDASWRPNPSRTNANEHSDARVSLLDLLGGVRRGNARASRNESSVEREANGPRSILPTHDARRRCEGSMCEVASGVKSLDTRRAPDGIELVTKVFVFDEPEGSTRFRRDAASAIGSKSNVPETAARPLSARFRLVVYGEDAGEPDGGVSTMYDESDRSRASSSSPLSPTSESLEVARLAKRVLRGDRRAPEEPKLSAVSVSGSERVAAAPRFCAMDPDDRRRVKKVLLFEVSSFFPLRFGEDGTSETKLSMLNDFRIDRIVEFVFLDEESIATAMNLC